MAGERPRGRIVVGDRDPPPGPARSTTGTGRVSPPLRPVRIALAVLLTVAGVGLAVQQVGPDVAGAWPLLRGSGVDPVRMIAAAVLSASSLAVYGELHRRLLGVAAAQLAGLTVQAVTVAGNAVSLTVPTVGTAAGPAYTVRALCRRGVTPAAAMWSVGAPPSSPRW